MPMTDKEQFDAFMKLADFRAMRWNTRRQAEWRGTLGLWVLMATATYYLKIRPPETLLILILIFVVLAHAFSILRAAARSQQDMDMAFYYTEHAEKSLLSSLPVPRTRPQPIDSLSTKELWVHHIYRNIGTAIGLVAPTVVLALVAYFLVGRSN